jgi:hypothetical protein
MLEYDTIVTQLGLSGMRLPSYTAIMALNALVAGGPLSMDTRKLQVG